jgi:biotin carboxyl carrier protein
MPGTVLGISAVVGQAVEEGEVLGVMEAMKMELSLRAPVTGTVSTVSASIGEQVVLGATLFVVTPTELSGGDPAIAVVAPDKSVEGKE